MGKGISPSQLDSALSAVLEEYSTEVYEGVKRAVDTTAKAVDKEIRRHITFRDRTGDYRRAFALRQQRHRNLRQDLVCQGWTMAADTPAGAWSLEPGRELDAGLSPHCLW